MSKLIMTVGLPACGKSTYSALMEKIGYRVISTDAIREELYGDEAIQGDGARVFAIAHGRALQALRNGHNVLLDATHLYRRSRASVARFKALGYGTEAIVFDVPVEVCKARNRARKRHVPDEVIDRMAERMSVPTVEEGFDDVHILRNE